MSAIVDKVNNHVGPLFRFITPVLVSIVVFMLGVIVVELRELKQQFTNHLSEHKVIELMLESRLMRIETILNKK